jgi:hypothetical protein
MNIGSIVKLNKIITLFIERSGGYPPPARGHGFNADGICLYDSPKNANLNGVKIDEKDLCLIVDIKNYVGNEYIRILTPRGDGWIHRSNMELVNDSR